MILDDPQADLWRDLVGAWHSREDPSGPTWPDRAAWQNDGTFNNLDPGTNWRIGPQGWVPYFQGGDRSIDVGTKAILEFSTAFTLAVRCRHLDAAYSAGTVRGLVNKYQAAGGQRSYSYFILHNGGKRMPYVYVSAPPGNSGVSCASYFDLDTNWHTLAFTFNAGQWVHYVDGVAVASSNSGVASLNNASSVPLRLGIDYNSRGFYGDLDSAYAWARALGAAELSELHAALLAGPEAAPQPAGLVPPTPGPYRVDAADTFTAGPVAGGSFHAGAVAGQAT